MKVAVTATGPQMDSEVDSRLARARYFIVVDTETGQFEAHDNSDVRGATHGAGVQAAEKLDGLGVQAVITGNCGPRAYQVLKAMGIEVFVGASGTVAEAVEKFKSGELRAAEGPNVESHWT